MIDGNMICPCCVAGDTIIPRIGGYILDFQDQLVIIDGHSYLCTEEAYIDFLDCADLGGCSCHMGGAPCSFCSHPGNPHIFGERDDVVKT